MIKRIFHYFNTIKMMTENQLNHYIMFQLFQWFYSLKHRVLEQDLVQIFLNLIQKKLLMR